MSSSEDNSLIVNSIVETSDEGSALNVSASSVQEDSRDFDVSATSSYADKSHVNSSEVEVAATESEASDDDEPIYRKTTAKNRIVSDDESSDEEEKLRKSIYEAEELEDETPIEDMAYSKLTRRSIDAGAFRSPHIANSDDSSDDESIIIEDSEEEVSQEKQPSKSKRDEQSAVSNDSRSTSIRSPLRQVFDNSATVNNSFNISIGTKMSSTTTSFKEDSQLLDEAAGGVEVKMETVSRSEFEAEKQSKEQLEREISKCLKLLGMSDQLPDKGAKLQSRLNSLLEQIDVKTKLITSLEIDETKGIKKEIAKSFQSSFENSIVSINDSIPAVDAIIKSVEAAQPKFTGKIGLQNFQHQQALTVEKLEDIQQNIEERPLETELDTPPKHLKVELMPHQLHAIKFMLWREKKQPRGGILADDMGLGKTLTAISVILKDLQRKEDDEETSDSEEDEKENAWTARGRKDLRSGGTLVVCPASLLKQWEHEIKTRVKRGALEVNVFHGPNRAYRAKDLARHDVVITTYQVAASEHKADGCLYKVKWHRIILDEGHVIRNHKSKQSEAICSLPGKFRWVLTGTPIQNKEFDLFAAVKFLRCSPFDELTYWKKWIEVKGDSSPRVQALLKSIMLRRTKQQLITSGEIESLPDKKMVRVDVELNREEKFVYRKLMSFSQSIFANYVKQHQDKNENYTYDQHQLGKLHKKFARRYNMDREVKQSELLTLLMRLRQACCHAGLIKQMLNAADIDCEVDGINLNHKQDESESDLMAQLQKLNIDDDEEDENLASQYSEKRFSAGNEVFNMDIPSSKIESLMEILREKVIDSDDKAIIVSQWTSYLAIIRGMLEVEDVKYCELNGTVPVKDRNDIVVEFNKKNSGVKVMLLSLTAGGVGLNLVGANYLFLMDLHWNPQMELQAQDRIYRFGQTKDIIVYKFICLDTIEEQVLKVQENKLAIATSSLTGAKKTAGTKLTMDDMMMLFGMSDKN